MDKKNTVIGVALLMAAFAAMYFSAKQQPAAPARPAQYAPATAGQQPAGVATAPGGTIATPGGTPVAPPLVATTGAATAEIKALAPSATGEATALLANAFIEVRLSNRTAAIEEVALRRFPDTLGSTHHFVFNQVRTGPMLGINALPGLGGLGAAFEVVSQSPREIVYRARLDSGRLELTRRYSLPDGSEPGTDPYQLQHETTLRNLSGDTLALPRLALSLGTVRATGEDVYGQQLTSGYSDGKKQHFIEHTRLKGGGFLSLVGIGSREPTPELPTHATVRWASLGNRFFASILTPAEPAVGIVTRRVPIAENPDIPLATSYGLGAEALFDLRPLAPQESSTLAMDFYVGPKAYPRLSNSDNFKANQDKVMNYGMFRFFSQTLLTMMNWVHGWLSPLSPKWAWGWAVVITTLTLKIVFLPFTLAASRSAKRMQKIQPEMQALREKFKDNPQKMQQATMELFKRHKVNPMGGCLPILVTMPFFIGFFVMLRTASELRFESFLWAADLSAPDTVARVFGLPLNIMPLLMGATMIIQMRLTPTPSADNMQAKLLKFMPWMFTLFCYNFSCALALYSTVNGIFTIGQQLIINRMKTDGPAPSTTPPDLGGSGSGKRSGKPLKNVSPPQRKKP